MGSGIHRTVLMAASASVAMAAATPAFAQTRRFDVPGQPAESGVVAFGRQADIEIVAARKYTSGKRTAPVRGAMTVDRALDVLLQGTGLVARRTGARTYIILSDSAASGPDKVGQPVSASDPPQDADDPSKDIIITAQKRAERIQDVPIAVTVLTAKALDEQKIEGGSELLRGTPNVSFTKTNFASYNFSIRGIGTQALSVTTDPAVAISFNSSPMIRNRLFEQEYFDVDRIEVLRGPQGTLYGRNATAGVVNMIPNLATADRFKADLKLETGNFGSMRASGMLNVPLTDTLAVRVAGAFTKRDGYDFNTVTNRDVNGRDLWGARGSITWKPSSRLGVSLVWEHFNEDDNRSRTGKQLCHTDPLAEVGDVTPAAADAGFLSQGCKGGSLYDPNAFGVVNGASLQTVQALQFYPGFLGFYPDGSPAIAVPQGTDPYAGLKQSTNLREIATTYDPVFRAKNDVIQLNMDLKLGEGLKLVSQTLYTKDSYYSSQDYDRFVSNSVFSSTSPETGIYTYGPDFLNIPAYNLIPNGIFCDPQLGCSNKILSADLNTSRSRQWSQEFRLQSDFDGRLNFNLGVNYLDFKIDEDYYVFNNGFTLIAENYFNTLPTGNFFGTGPVQNCTPGQTSPSPLNPSTSCIYIDPNPLSSINGEGHNYFRSRNLARTQSKAIFGELYWKATDTLKFTAGLRYTDDLKKTMPVPSQLLLAPGNIGGGYVNSGYPASPDIRQHWGEITGRAVIDWKPRLAFTDDTLFYASYSHGYKAGGTNSPGIGSDPQLLPFPQHNPLFKPEFVNAFEIGTKNVLAGGKLTFNATAFFYDYKNYQVSQIVDRATLNENFNARIWGLELETTWAPVRDLRFNANVGYLGTRISRDQYSIDVMNRTQGNPDWVVVKPWIQAASNCIAPKALVESVLRQSNDPNGPTGGAPAGLALIAFCPAAPFGNYLPDNVYSGQFGITYNPLTDAPNGGQGFAANVGGKELPNAPHWTANIGAQYTFHLADWDLTMRGDYYRQASSWARVYNDAIDRLKGWGNANLALTLARPASDLTFQLYVKNLFNDVPITGTFLNSDDSGLTTNVFTLDPRIIGFSIAKKF